MTETKKTPTRKRCSRCRKQKDLSQFSLSCSGKHGRHNYCKQCRKSERDRSRQVSRIITPDASKLHIGQLTFVQHHDSVNEIIWADRHGVPLPQPMYAYFGGLKLSEADVMRRVRYLQGQGEYRQVFY